MRANGVECDHAFRPGAFPAQEGMRMRLSTVNVLLYPGFELLDAMGPIELLANVQGVNVRTVYIPEPDAEGSPTHPKFITSAQGVRVSADAPITDPCELLLIPGGMGARELVQAHSALAQIRRAALAANVVASVCTGSALLAAAGLLEGYRATSNKQAFQWATSFGTAVEWVPRARWVHDRDRWTSSGVSAGMDMTAALILDAFGSEVYESVLNDVEYSPTSDPRDDPFAIPGSSDANR